MSGDPESFQDGSTEVTKVGGRALCTRHQGGADVKRLFTILEHGGLRYLPRFLGLFDDSRQVLKSIEDQAGVYPLPEEPRHDEALISATRALRLLYEMTSRLTTEVPDGWILEVVKPYEAIYHGDLIPYDCIFDGNRLAGIIGFNAAYPDPRIRNIAHAIYRSVPLAAPKNAAGFGPLAEQARRVWLSCDKYGEVSRSEITEVVCRRSFDLVRYMCAQATRGDTALQSHPDDGHDTLYLHGVHYLRTNAAILTRALI